MLQRNEHISSWQKIKYDTCLEHIKRCGTLLKIEQTNKRTVYLVLNV